MYNRIRPYLFRLDPERANELTLNALSFAGRFIVTRALLEVLSAVPAKPVTAFGLTIKKTLGFIVGAFLVLHLLPFI